MWGFANNHPIAFVFCVAITGWSVFMIVESIGDIIWRWRRNQ